MAGKGWTNRGSNNHNGQINLGSTMRPSSTYANQIAYVMHCPKCVCNNGANGCDIHDRLCPYHQGG